MNKWIYGGLGAAFVAFAAWYSLSPGMAMAGLRDAVKDGDKQQPEERVNFPQVCESLKTQLKAKLAGEMAKQGQGEQNGFAAFGAMLAMSMVDGLINGMVTPDGLKALVENGRFNTKGTTSAPAKEAD